MAAVAVSHGPLHKLTHPALLSPVGLPTPPLSPISPTTKPITPTNPIVFYAMLRAHHANALKYTIARLRWDQTHNGYLKNEDAWHQHNRMISKLEDEVADVEEAQKGLDRFPNCFAPTAFPKPHGPPSKEQFEKEIKEERERLKELDEKLEAHFPWVRQLFIGPMTLNQARKNKMLREALAEGDLDDEDLSVLLPSVNMRMLVEGGPHGENLKADKEKKDKNHDGGEKEKKEKKPYQQERYEKERAKVNAALEASPPKKSSPKPRVGPLTKEEWIASLPKFGPLAQAEALLPAQREQRHAILTWLRKPWGVYDEQAAGLLERLAKVAGSKLESEARARARGEKAEKEKAEKEKAESRKVEKAKEEKK